MSWCAEFEFRGGAPPIIEAIEEVAPRMSGRVIE